MIAAGRFDDGSAGRRTPRMTGAFSAGIRKARSAESAPFLRLGSMLLHRGWLIGRRESPSRPLVTWQRRSIRRLGRRWSPAWRGSSTNWQSD
jgi:hypothetical protein